MLYQKQECRVVSFVFRSRYYRFLNVVKSCKSFRIEIVTINNYFTHSGFRNITKWIEVVLQWCNTITANKDYRILFESYGEEN